MTIRHLLNLLVGVYEFGCLLGGRMRRQMRSTLWRFASLALSVGLLWPSAESQAADTLPDVIERIKPSVVVIGTYQLSRSPAFLMRGTGFVVGAGNHVATNAHVLPELVDVANGERLVIQLYSPKSAPQMRQAKIDARDNAYDMALLRIDGDPVPALTFAQDTPAVREGLAVGFTGFPIGAVLGLSPVTHRGIISAITPIALPSPTAGKLNEKLIRRLKAGAFEVYQLDATAYPGNSGGPLFELETGRVIGIVNMVFVKGTKESALTQPSGISFAIPIRYLQDLLRESP